ncbi:hypothetical protein DYB37_007235 [Aphanomyces astaci]|uniref:Uncharacterized protein n=1 Tax=Aphanomyces astaci TaxID=112090 RepID=A0A3R7BZ33_APHAT|nr:hypothetical protein DYB35_003683 [Aphanomyces astaci]RHZ27871.1 hypothetical protein DYB37_007235 [Aphanomyces astaci]
MKTYPDRRGVLDTQFATVVSEMLDQGYQLIWTDQPLTEESNLSALWPLLGKAIGPDPDDDDERPRHVISWAAFSQTKGAKKLMSQPDEDEKKEGTALAKKYNVKSKVTLLVVPPFTPVKDMGGLWSHPVHYSKVPLVTEAYWPATLSASGVGDALSAFLSVACDFGGPSTLGMLSFIFVCVLVSKLSLRQYAPGMYWLVFVVLSATAASVGDVLAAVPVSGVPIGGSILVLSVLLL